MKRTRLSYDEWSCIISKDLYGKEIRENYPFREQDIYPLNGVNF